MMKPLALAAALLALAGAAQAQDCGKAATTLDMRACAEIALERADAALNASYRALLDEMADALSYDAGLAAKAEDNLRTAQRAWITTRDNDCAVAGHAVAGGSLAPLTITQCLTDTTQSRTKALDALRAHYTEY